MNITVFNMSFCVREAIVMITNARVRQTQVAEISTDLEFHRIGTKKECVPGNYQNVYTMYNLF